MKNCRKNFLRSRSGITLIALVITIIVLLILAVISISMLSGENSILTKAEDARNRTGEKQIEEKIQLAYSGALVNGQGTITENILDYELKKYFSSFILDYANEKVTIEDKDYGFDGTVVGENTSNEWTQNSEGKIVSSHGTVQLQIGDYVNYSTANSEVTTITSNKTDNGYNDQTFSLDDYSAGWRVLGVKNGKIELISEDIILPVVSPNKNKYFSLQGRIGYQNVETELNKIASLYGHGIHATGARSVNIDDINRITGYNPNAEGIKNPTQNQITGENKYGKGYLNEYGNEVTYSWVGTDYPKYESTNGKTGNLSQSHNLTNSDYGDFQNAFSWFDFNTNSWKKSAYTENASINAPVEITKLTSTSYSYYPETLTSKNDTTATIGIANNSAEMDMLFNNTDSKYYWLASRYVDTRYNYAFRCSQCKKWSC